MKKNRTIIALIPILLLLIALPFFRTAPLQQQTIYQHASPNSNSYLIQNITPPPPAVSANSATYFTPCVKYTTFISGVYLKANGNQFAYNGQKVCLFGSTIYTSQGTNVPNYNWKSTNFPQRIDWDLALAQKAKLNIIRPTDQTNSATDDPYNSVVWQNMDYLIQQTKLKGMFVELDLSTYANHLVSQKINPFDSTQEPGWQKYISFVANRYKNAPNISNYSLEGEVNPVGSSAFPNSTTQGYLDFFSRVTTDTYNADAGAHLIAAGGLSYINDTNYLPYSKIPWKDIFKLSHVNMATIHVYPANTLDPINSNQDLSITMPNVGNWAVSNNKPAEVEEYGFIQQLSDANRASAIHAIYQSAHNNKFSGLIFWNLGPEVLGGSHYDENPNYPLAWQEITSDASNF